MATQWENSVIKFIVQKITKTSLSFSNKTAAVRSKKMLLSRPCSMIVRYHYTSNTSSLFNWNLFRRRSFSVTLILCFRAEIMTMTDIQLRRATLEDEQGILDIMKEENLWEGMDSGLTW